MSRANLAVPDAPSPPDRRSRGGRHFPALLLILVLAAVLIAYADALRAWFASDDFLWLSLADPASVLASFTGSWGHGPAYRPLTRVSFYVDHLLFGFAAGGWHAHSLLLHVAAATLLGCLVERLSNDRVFAAASALIFALLPLSYENTIWISGRGYPLALTLSLGSLILFDGYLLRPSLRRLAAAFALYGAALLAYETSVVVPGFAVLLVLLRRRELASGRSAAVGVAALVLACAGYAALRVALVGTATLYPARAPDELVSTGLLRQLTFSAEIVLRQLEPSPLLFLAGALLAIPFAPAWTGAALVGVLAALMAFAPFALANALAPRFFYTGQAGIAVAAAACLRGLASVPWLGKPAALALFAALALHEVTEVRATAREWREAGGIMRRSLARVASVPPGEAGRGATLVFGVPVAHGRGMTALTYFELAMHLFHPTYPRLAIPEHYFTRFDAPTGFGSLASVWHREQARRAAAGLRPIGCGRANPRRSQDRVAMARALLDCDTLFVEVDDRHQWVRAMSSSEAEIRLARSLGPLGAPRRPRRRRARAQAPPAERGIRDERAAQTGDERAARIGPERAARMGDDGP